MTEKKSELAVEKRIDGGHNIGPNVAILDVGLMSGDVTSSYNGDIDSSSNNIFTNNIRIFG